MNEKIKKLIEDNLIISYRQFEKEAGVSRQTIYNIINSNNEVSLLTVKKICKYFKVDYKDFVE